MRRTPSIAAAAVVLTAAVALLTGCGGDGEPTARTGERPNSATRIPGNEKLGQEGQDGEQPPRSEGNEEEDGPKVPAAELTPATGSFTEKEREYLAGRVPTGMEPAAILEAGTEACQRIGRTAAVDRKAAAEAIASGEIANAEHAITHLCPEHRDLL